MITTTFASDVPEGSQRFVKTSFTPHCIKPRIIPSNRVIFTSWPDNPKKHSSELYSEERRLPHQHPSARFSAFTLTTLTIATPTTTAITTTVTTTVTTAVTTTIILLLLLLFLLLVLLLLLLCYYYWYLLKCSNLPQLLYIFGGFSGGPSGGFRGVRQVSFEIEILRNP